MITLEGVVRKVQIFLHILVIHKKEKNMKVGRIAILPTVLFGNKLVTIYKVLIVIIGAVTYGKELYTPGEEGSSIFCNF